MEVIACGAFRICKHPKSPYWQVRAEAAPRTPLFKSTKETNQTKAMKVAKQLYSEWSKEIKTPSSKQILFKDLHKEYLEAQASYSRKASTKIRTESLGDLHLIPAFGNRFLSEIQSLWPKFVREQKRLRPDSTLFNERKLILAELRYAYDLGLIEKVPPIPLVPGKKKPIRVFTDHEIRRLLQGCGADDELRLNILMGFCMGMRHGEIAKLEIADIDLKGQIIHIQKTKTGIDRSIAINAAVIEPLQKQVSVAKARGSRFLFPQVHNTGTHKNQRVFDKAWQELKSRLNVTGNFHGLRHSCANRLKQSHVPPPVAAAYLGMSARVYDVTYGKLGTEDTKPAAGVIRLTSEAEESVISTVGGT